MRKLNKIVILLSIVLSVWNDAVAQTNIPQLVNFQAVARDDKNQPIIKKPIQIKLIILQGGSKGTPVYGAIYEDSTNEYGEFTRLLGSDPTYSIPNIPTNFTAIPWQKGDMWVSIEYKGNIAGSFKSIGLFQYLSQPYSFASKYAEKLNVPATNGQVLAYNGTDWAAKTIDQPVLSKVATSGKWDDLEGKPVVPSSTSQLNNDAGFSVIPAGTIVPFGGDQVPAGWLLCDGKSYASVGNYANLFSAIGTAWGSGGAGSFNVPDLRGRFLRGVDAGAGRDLDMDKRIACNPGGFDKGKVGSVQNDEIKSHSHQNGIGWGGGPNNGGLGRADGNSPANMWGTNLTGGSETRPKNAYVNYIIKY